MFKPWPHQVKGVEETLAAIARGERRILLSSPTGGGKTWMMAELIRSYLEDCRKVILYTNRKMLVEQTSRVLAAEGLNVGVRAAGYLEQHDLLLQVSSIQTENTRVLKGGTWHLHEAELVLIDEAHLQRGAVARQLLDAHIATGATYVGLTATPIDLKDLYDILIVAGNMSELRECGALLWCNIYGPDEPDLRHVKGIRLGDDLSEQQAVKAMMTPGIFGRVYEWFERLNPEHRPTILFAPGVAESLGFAEDFVRRGISAAHIDGANVWIDGKLYRTDKKARKAVLAGSKSGDIRVICNRFVLREGIDAPWLSHGVFATVFGSLQSCLQSGGRLLRNHPGVPSVTLQDHGGNWWRHGSLNANRKWNLNYSSGIISGMREDQLRNSAVGEREPFRCEKCGLIMMGTRCKCGHVIPPKYIRSRPVIMTDGQLVELSGRIFKPRRTYGAPNGPKLWERMYFRSCSEKGRRTFRAAAALFASENNWGWPDMSWPFMPIDPMDWYRDCGDVPRDKLRGKNGRDGEDRTPDSCGLFGDEPG